MVTEVHGRIWGLLVDEGVGERRRDSKSINAVLRTRRKFCLRLQLFQPIKLAELELGERRLALAKGEGEKCLSH